MRAAYTPPTRLSLVEVSGRVYRSHQACLGAWYLSIGKSANRFDDPAGKFGVCYTAASAEAAFAETFLRKPVGQFVPIEELEHRALTCFRFSGVLRLVDLTGAGLAKNSATASITAGDIASAQAVAAQLYSHPDAPDGIRYRVRHDNDHYGYALFDHVRPPAVVQSLSWSDRALLSRMVERYELAL